MRESTKKRSGCKCEKPDKATCGNCQRSWCATCDPGPAALCPYCHGRGHSTAPLGTIKAKKAKPKAKGTHTPGPWQYGRVKVWEARALPAESPHGAARLVDGRGWFFGPEGRGLDIGEVHHTASQDGAEQEANARLIAAAPELLAACRVLVAWADEQFPVGHKDMQAVNLARRAIAKAKGGDA